MTSGAVGAIVRATNPRPAIVASCAYLAVQMAGIHLMAQAGLVTLVTWICATAILGYRARAVPRWLALLAALASLRVVALLGPLGVIPDDLGVLWPAFMASIPAAFLWLAILGLVLLRAPAAMDVQPEVATTAGRPPT